MLIMCHHTKVGRYVARGVVGRVNSCALDNADIKGGSLLDLNEQL